MRLRLFHIILNVFSCRVYKEKFRMELRCLFIIFYYYHYITAAIKTQRRYDVPGNRILNEPAFLTVKGKSVLIYLVGRVSRDGLIGMYV